jgi:YD repeat-containing protein
MVCVCILMLLHIVMGLIASAAAQTPTMTLSYAGNLRDKVGQGNTALSGDGQLDGTFTLTLGAGSGARSVTALELRSSTGGIWDTHSSTPYWTVGVGSTLDSALYQSGSDSVNVSLAAGGSVRLFAGDLTPPTTLYSVGTTFTLTVTFADGSTATASTAVSTGSAPSITNQPANVTVTAPSSATFSVTATGTAPLSYQWQKNGADISGATSASYTTPATAPDSGSTFLVVVSNSAGSVTSSAATLTVNAGSVAPTITVQPISVTVTASATATYTVSATGTQPLLYQWQKGAVDIADATSASYTTPPTSPTDSGSSFRVVVSNNGGTVTSSDATLTVTTGGRDISYLYDELNRLIAVVDPATDIAIYQYDAVGNLLSISRQRSAQVSIIDFWPRKGIIGTVVTISGTGFSDVPAENTVLFNGTSAIVTSGSLTQLAVIVPVGATNGLITVNTANRGSAVSAAAFNVAPQGVPTISSVSPLIGLPGTPVTITGTNFDPQNTTVKFGTTPAQVTSVSTTKITTTVPAQATSDAVSVTTRSGTVITKDDFLVTVLPSAVTIYDPRLTLADVEMTGRMSIDGPSRTITLNAARKVAVIVFDGSAGQQISLGFTDGSLQGLTNVWLYTPLGMTRWRSNTTSPIVTYFGGSGGSMSPREGLPASGTYMIVVQANEFAHTRGSITLTLSSAVRRVVSLDGSPVTATATRPWQNVRVDFNGKKGQRVTLAVLGDITFRSANADLRTSAGTSLANTSLQVSSSGQVGILTPADPLPADGVYTLVIYPQSSTPGTVTVTAYEKTEITRTITIDGDSLTLPLLRPAQAGRVTFTFSGAAPQRLSLMVTDATFPYGVSLYKPDGSLWTSSGFRSVFSSLQFTTPGTYTILVTPDLGTTGTMTLKLFSDKTGTVGINDPPITVTIGGSGQNARYTFNGTAGQQVTVSVTNNTMKCFTAGKGVSVSLVNPSTNTRLGGRWSCTSGPVNFSFIVPNLPESNNYTIAIIPFEAGSLDLRVTSP